MNRELDALLQRFDVLVIGAGVHGACIARLAAQAGLKTALIDKGDFGSATSRNSAKLLHGGLRYVQHLDVLRIRESMVAQRAWFRFAPHLVRPLRFVIPTYGWATRGPAALAGGIAAFHIIAAGRNAGIPKSLRLPGSGVMSRGALLAAYPVLESGGITGGAYWHDGQMLDAVRLTMECVLDAVAAGATAVNHVECVSLLSGRSGVEGAVCRDATSGREVEVRADLTINATGPWVDHVLYRGPATIQGPRITAWTRNINLVTKPLYQEDVALGVASQQASDASIGKSKRLFFMSPWQGCTVVGTTHDLCADHPDEIDASDTVVGEFISEVNASLAGVRLDPADVLSVHLGMTPAEEGDSGRAKRSLLVDHEERDGMAGFLSVAGIKYTTAPVVATKAVELACRKLGRPVRVPAFERLAAGAPPASHYSDMLATSDEVEWSRRIYGSRADDCLAGAEGGTLDAILRRRVTYGIEREMVTRLSDALFRASDAAERGILTKAQFEWCADELQNAHGWPPERRESELADAVKQLQRLRIRVR